LVVVLALAGLTAASIALAEERKAVASDSPGSATAASAQLKAEGGTPSAMASPSAGKSHAAAHAAMHRLDLNEATKEQLTKVPGIDEAMADKIIAGRPYKSKAELESKKVLSAAEYKKLAAHFMVKTQSPSK
jgi:DNA uptake protein ComE-like DNA-binding protein